MSASPEIARDPARAHALSLAFMRSHPAAAARVLEGMAAADAAAVFERSPARLAAPVLAAMLPKPAADCVDLMTDERALELLTPLSTQAIVALLRGMAQQRRGRLIAGLPTTASLASALLLGYAQESVGAWSDPDLIALSADTPAGEALEKLRASEAPLAAVYIVDAERRLGGVVTLPALLRAAPTSSLASVMQRPPVLLQAQSALAEAATHPAWEQTSALPVVDPGGRLVGVMTHDALLRAVRRAAPPPPGAATLAGVPEFLALAYWNSVAGLAAAALTLLPRVREVSRAGVEHHER